MPKWSHPMSPERREQIRQWALGRKHSPETKAKMSAAKLGKTKSAETRAKMGQSNGRHVRTPEMRARHSAVMTGRKLSEAHRASSIAALRRRTIKAVSEETRAKMSAAKIGKPGPWLGKKRGPMSPEWAAKIGAASKGRPCSYARRQSYNGRSFRSSWEVRVAQVLDRFGVRWEYEPRRFDIDDTATFLPDFYLPDDGAYWEVKGWYDDFSRKRVEGFRRRYPDIPLVLINKQALELLEASTQRR